MTPLEKTEAFYRDLVDWYGEGDDREARAAAKLLMVALIKFKEHGGPGWQDLAEEYFTILKRDPERFLRMLDSNRGVDKVQPDPLNGQGNLIA